MVGNEQAASQADGDLSRKSRGSTRSRGSSRYRAMEAKVVTVDENGLFGGDAAEEEDDDEPESPKSLGAIRNLRSSKNN